MGNENSSASAHIIKKSASDELKRIEDLVKNIKFGSVMIHVEDGKIIQVDKNEKIRFR